MTETVTTANPTLENPFLEEVQIISGVRPLTGPDSSELYSELGVFLTWAHTVASPFDDNFVSSVLNFSQWVSQSITTPAGLYENGDTLGRLKLMVETIEQEYTRLRTLHQEFCKWKTQMEQNYSEEQAQEWLRQHLPDVYARLGVNLVQVV